MSDRKLSGSRPHQWNALRLHLASQARHGGQALIEYVLIITLVTLAIIAVLAITGPAAGNVFSNVVYNLVGGTVEPRHTLSADEFWNQVAAVASYTPSNPMLQTNTPAPVTNTPTTGPSSTPTPITPSPLPTKTNTPGPSPTPPDQNFGYPFEDQGNNPDWWEHDFENLLDVTWNAEYWNYSSFLSDMTSFADGTGKQNTVAALDYELASGSSPMSGVSENYYARYKATAKLEDKRYTFRILKNNGIRIWVGGNLVVGKDKPNAGDLETWPTSWSADPIQNTIFERSFTPAAGDNEIIVEFFDSGSGASLHVALIEDGLLDTGDCNWTLSDEAYHSAPKAWVDSPGGANYVAKSNCILALRGYIDLRGSSNPKLEFWDRYNLADRTAAYVSVSVAGTGNWTDVKVHGYETDLAWARQTYDLKNFGDPDAEGPGLGRDFSKDLIEVRFILYSWGTSTADGWYVDDITVQERVIKRYTVGFADDMEGGVNWIPGGTWALSNEQTHSGLVAWSDSPSASYTHGSNSTLELDGIIDLVNDSVIEPELVFWHRYNLAYNDAIFAEISTNDRITWTPLTGTYIARNDINLGWIQTVISLSTWKGQEIYFRFRLDARTSTSVSDGWWIDDFTLRNEPTTVITPDWCDNMEVGGGDWVPEGSWGLISGVDTSESGTQKDGQYVSAHSGSQFWSDSPRADYQHSTESSLMLKSRLDLTGTTDPQMVFWHQWDLGSSDDLYVEVSQDEGVTWSTVVDLSKPAGKQAWTYQYNNLPPGYITSINRGYNHLLSWMREEISLRQYIGKVIMVRFRLDALSYTEVDDGWWIDDVCFQERNEPTRGVGFSDGFEMGPVNWYEQGTWAIVPENRHSGAVAYADSPGVVYKHETNGILELRGAINLTDAVLPTLYFWEAHNVNYNDYIITEVNTSTDNGLTWNGWKDIGNYNYSSNPTTTSWDRRQLDLAPYVGQQIRLRFRVYAVSDGRTAEGVWIDDVSILDRSKTELTFPLPFNEDVETVNTYWVMDGTWSRIPSFRVVNSGARMGPGGWAAEYYNDVSNYGVYDAGELRATCVEAEITFPWSGSAPTCNGAAIAWGTDSNPGTYFLARFTRTINVMYDNTQIQLQTRSDDGVRVKVDGGPWLIDKWIGRGVPSTPDTYDLTLSAGPHTIVVEYFQGSGNSWLQLEFGITGKAFHDSPSGNYYHQNDMSVMFDHWINLAGTTYPALSYDERRYLASGDNIYTEISTDGGFNWSAVRSKNGTSSSWYRELVDLSGFAGEKIKIRFRLDARTNTAVSDGWYIDEIQLAE